MKVFFAFISLFTLALSLVFFYRVGGLELVAAIVLLVLSIHLEIGLRVSSSVRFMTDVINRAIGG